MEASGIIRCPVCGHSYDARRDDGCPNCSRIALGPDAAPDNDRDVTVMQGAGFKSADLNDGTVSTHTPLPGDPNDVTVGTGASKSGGRRGEVTGWLVCTQGPDFGRDFRLRYNNNFVGRDMDMDVCLASDAGVHRQKHMTVVYEPRENTFYCAPLGGAICYLNGEVLIRAARLRDFDRLRLGATELLFRSLCGEEYRW